MFEMVVRAIAHTPSSFSDKVELVAERAHGAILFDVRVDGDRHIQRIAGVGYPSEGLGVLALARIGGGLIAHFARERLEDFTSPLINWSRLTLPEQATRDCHGATLLLVGALRNRGYILRVA